MPASVCLVLLTTLWLTAAVAAGNPKTLSREQRFDDINSLILKDISGDIQIIAEDRPDVLLRLQGPPHRVRSVALEVQGHRLLTTLQASPDNDSSQGYNIVEHSGVTVIARDGGRASVVIGGLPANKNEPPLTLRFRVPRSTTLEATGLVGDLQAQGAFEDVRLTLLSGQVGLDTVHGGRIVVSGAGNVNIEKARGRLHLSVSGSGSITVTDADLEALEARVTGAGDITVEGVTRNADLSITGVGDIAVQTVRERPVTHISGAGEIRIGNR